MLILELRVVDDAKVPVKLIAVVPLAVALNDVTNPSGSAVVDKAPLIVKAFAEPVPPVVEIPSGQYQSHLYLQGLPDLLQQLLIV